ncbi:MAG TPA: DUF305 domain-containing protein [Methylophilaceae bacterium]|nr:DUF305 domain-containing protein [Methylophilaceae bacterium]
MEHPYKKLLLAIAINGIVMFFVMYAMLYSFDHFYLNINRLYMALMMVAPMVIVMLLVMAGMFPNKTANLTLHLVFLGLFVASLVLARTQMPVGNVQFLRSMIPHHSSAILMCEQASITDPEIKSLCGEIIDSQRREIGEMKRLLSKYSPQSNQH